MTLTRRSFFARTATLVLASRFPAVLRAAPALDAARASAELAHAELWRRFVDEHDVLLDFTDLDGSVSLPTAEECRAGKPNALGWWAPSKNPRGKPRGICPDHRKLHRPSCNPPHNTLRKPSRSKLRGIRPKGNENGAMFNGLYLDGAVARALRTKAEADKAKARRLVEGLLRLASRSEVKGFVGRGFASDGRTTWPMGSNDQSSPWFYGLWRYLESGLADDALRGRLVAKFAEVANVLVQTGWRMPAEPPFNFRGSFNGFTWGGAPRLLFVCKAMHQLTGEAAWEKRYLEALHEAPKRGGSTRLAACERGMVFEKKSETKASRATWTGSCAAVCLRGLWEMERDEAVRAAFARGLRATADVAAEGMKQRAEFDPAAVPAYEADWRKLNALWKPQQTEDEAQEVAQAQLREINRISPARVAELRIAREPMFAAWVTTLCPEREVVKRHEAEILATIAHFRADKLRFVSFFPLECAWWRLQA